MSKELEMEIDNKKETARPREDVHRLETEIIQTRSELNRRMDELGHRVSPKHIKDKVLRRASDRFQDVKHNIAHSAEESYDRAREKVVANYRQTRETAVHQYNEHPLVVCGLAFGAGLLLGSLIPVAEKERQVLRKPAGRMRDQLDESAADLIERGQQKVEETLASRKDHPESVEFPAAAPILSH